jgi:hypothetical protein
MRRNTLDTVWYAVLQPARDWVWDGVKYHEPPQLLSASKTNMPALYMSRKMAENNCLKGSTVITVKVVEHKEEA